MGQYRMWYCGHKIEHGIRPAYSSPQHAKWHKFRAKRTARAKMAKRSRSVNRARARALGRKRR